LRRVGLLGAVVVVLAGLFGVRLLQQNADTHRQAATVVTHIEVLTHELVLAETRSEQDTDQAAKLALEADAIDTSLVSALADMDRLEPGSGRAAEVRVAVHSYRGATQSLLGLLGRGDIAAAQLWRHSLVEPTYANLVTTLEEAAQQYQAQADLATAMSDVGTLVIVMLAGVVAGALLWRWQILGQLALRSSEARFRSLVQNAPDMITVVDPSGVILMDTPAIQRVLGYAPEARIGISALEFVHPDDLRLIQDRLAQLVAQPDVTGTLELRARQADGSWRWLQGHARNELANPHVGGLVLNYRDVTERKAFEQRLEGLAFRDVLTGLPNRGV